MLRQARTVVLDARWVAVAAAAVVLGVALTSRPTDLVAVADEPVFVLVFVVSIALGEVVRLAVPGRPEVAPVAMAAALALVLTDRGLAGRPGPVTLGTVLVLVAAGLVAGGALRRLSGRRARPADIASRFLAVTGAALLHRSVVAGGRSLADLQGDLDDRRWAVALVMLVVSAVAALLELVLTAMCRSEREHAPAWATVKDAVVTGILASLALLSSGPLIALAERALGVAAVPLFLIPMVFTLFAVRRYTNIRVTYRETILALSRLTDIAGQTRTLHASRVAKLAVRMGRDLGMTQREVADLEYAALLHDLGQVALRDPIPGGATVLAAPGDQLRIAHDGARIVRATGVLAVVADAIDEQTRPFRETRELGRPLPLAARIIKVANAYDDFLGDGVEEADSEGALERIHLGLGYEYDPLVVDSLTRVLRRRRRHGAAAPRA